MEFIVCWMDWVKFSIGVSMEYLFLVLKLLMADRLEIIFLIYESVLNVGVSVSKGTCSRLQAELGCDRNIIKFNCEFVRRKRHEEGRCLEHCVCNINWLTSVSESGAPIWWVE